MQPRKLVLLALSSLLLLLACIAAWNYWRSRDWIEMQLYDLSHPQSDITSKAEIDKVLDQFEKVSFKDLPDAYLKYSQSAEKPFRAMLNKKTYYKIEGRDIYQKLIAAHRVRDFLPKDKYFVSHMRQLRDGHCLYLLLDRRLLYKFLELKKELAAEGYDPEAYELRSVFRHPRYNKARGGASRSRHILGEALDIGIRDINQDGKSDKADKDIVLEMLDKKIIGNQGGIGLYPNTQAVHFDVRGRRARWNSY